MTGKECVICGGQESEGELLLAAPCGRHWVCSDDISTFFERATENESLYPPKCCGQIFMLQEYEEYVPFEVAWSYQIKEQGEYAILAKFRVYCSNPSCGKFIRPSSQVTDPETNITYATCEDESCRQSTCTGCKMLLDQGTKNHICKKDENDEKFKQAAIENGYQECNICGATVELSEACNHIMCECGHEFCYICGKNWNGQHGCPQYGKAIYDEEGYNQNGYHRDTALNREGLTFRQEVARHQDTDDEGTEDGDDPDWEVLMHLDAGERIIVNALEGRAREEALDQFRIELFETRGILFGQAADNQEADDRDATNSDADDQNSGDEDLDDQDGSDQDDDYDASDSDVSDDDSDGNGDGGRNMNEGATFQQNPPPNHQWDTLPREGETPIAGGTNDAPQVQIGGDRNQAAEDEIADTPEVGRIRSDSITIRRPRDRFPDDYRVIRPERGIDNMETPPTDSDDAELMTDSDDNTLVGSTGPRRSRRLNPGAFRVGRPDHGFHVTRRGEEVSGYRIVRPELEMHFGLMPDSGNRTSITTRRRREPSNELSDYRIVRPELDMQVEPDSGSDDDTLVAAMRQRSPRDESGGFRIVRPEPRTVQLLQRTMETPTDPEDMESTTRLDGDPLSGATGFRRPRGDDPGNVRIVRPDFGDDNTEATSADSENFEATASSDNGTTTGIAGNGAETTEQERTDALWGPPGGWPESEGEDL